MRALLTAACLLLLTACGTTLERQENRFKKNTDTLEAVATKQPKMASAIKAKLQGFKTERDAIVKAGGEDAKTKLAQLNSRIEAYAVKLDPSLAPKAAAKSAKSVKGAAKGKLKQPASKAAASVKPATKLAPATAGKLAAPASKLGAPSTGKLGTPATTGKLGAGSQPVKPASKLGGAGSQPVKPGTP